MNIGLNVAFFVKSRLAILFLPSRPHPCDKPKNHKGFLLEHDMGPWTVTQAEGVYQDRGYLFG